MANKNSSLGDRMKQYEYVTRNYLPRRIPVIIRLDGKAFHTFTRGLEKPFDSVMMRSMRKTMQYLCQNIQGCVLGYTQSDEISLALTDYATVKTDAWFGYNIQKMCSVSAAMATLAFNEAFENYFCEEWDNGMDSFNERHNTMLLKLHTAMFDSRVFSVPKDEVCNCMIWRQQDATRNSIEAVGQANFSTSELHRKTCDQIQEMLWSKKGINWNDYPTDCKRGACCVKILKETEMKDPRDSSKTIAVQRRVWEVDRDIPIFTQDRSYIEKLL